MPTVPKPDDCSVKIVSCRSIEEVSDYLHRIGIPSGNIQHLDPKSELFFIELGAVATAKANILKQTMRSMGPDLGKSTTNVVFLGTFSHYHKLIEKLKSRFYELFSIAEKMEQFIEQYRKGLFNNRRRKLCV